MQQRKKKPLIDTPLIWVIGISIILSFVAILMVLKPSFISVYDLSSNEAANIGSTIGGITAPILTLLTASLLYLTLKRQTESNDIQRLKNDVDVILRLYSQLETDYRETSQVTTTTGNFEKGKGRVKETYYGFEAFQKLCHMFKNDLAKVFAEKNEASKILFIIQSYNALDKLITISSIEENLKGIIERKTHNFYLSRMRDPLANLAFHLRPNEDKYSKEAVDFFIAMEKRTMKEFDLYSVEKVEDLFIQSS